MSEQTSARAKGGRPPRAAVYERLASGIADLWTQLSGAPPSRRGRGHLAWHLVRRGPPLDCSRGQHLGAQTGGGPVGTRPGGGRQGAARVPGGPGLCRRRRLGVPPGTVLRPLGWREHTDPDRGPKRSHGPSYPRCGTSPPTPTQDRTRRPGVPPPRDPSLPGRHGAAQLGDGPSRAGRLDRGHQPLDGRGRRSFRETGGPALPVRADPSLSGRGTDEPGGCSSTWSWSGSATHRPSSTSDSATTTFEPCAAPTPAKPVSSESSWPGPSSTTCIDSSNPAVAGPARLVPLACVGRRADLRQRASGGRQARTSSSDPGSRWPLAVVAGGSRSTSGRATDERAEPAASRSTCGVPPGGYQGTGRVGPFRAAKGLLNNHFAPRNTG